MKKILILFPILMLLVSGCSYKNGLDVNKNKIINESAPLAPLKEEMVPTSNQETTKPKISLTAVKSNSGPRHFKCNDGPVKLSNISEGDYLDSYQIKKIDYTISDDGQLRSYFFSLEGEQILTGSLSVSLEYGGPIWFQLDQPIWGIYSTGGELPVYAECNNFSFDLNTKYSGCGTMLNDKGDFVGYGKCSFKSSDKLSDFDNFWSKAKDGDAYPKKVIIKVNNFYSGAMIGGEGGSWADLVEIVNIIN